MKKAIACCAISMALFAGLPAVAFADDADQDTKTEAVEVAVEGDETIDEPSSPDPESSTGTKGTPSSPASAQKTPSTGDQLMDFVIPCAVAAVMALMALVAAVFNRIRSGKRSSFP